MGSVIPHHSSRVSLHLRRSRSINRNASTSSSIHENKSRIVSGSKRKKAAYALVFLLYFLGGAAFFYFGLQPSVSPSEVYAAESATAEYRLEIPSIALGTPVAAVSLNGNDLEVPRQIAGAYSVHSHKTLLIGHSATVFKDLSALSIGQEIVYNDKSYTITALETKEKSAISMKSILQAAETDTVVLMTCAGEQISATDYSHRLIITAVAP